MKNRVAELEQRRNGLQARIDGIHTAFISAGGNQYSVEQSAQLHDLSRKLRQADIDYDDALFKAERDGSLEPARRDIGRDRSIAGAETFQAPSFARQPVGGTGRTFAEMFGAQPARAPISINEFMQSLHSGTHHPEIAAAAMSEATGGDGGFLVPDEFVARMLDISLEDEIVRPRARIEPMSSATKLVAGFDNTDHSLNIGGFTALWGSELGTWTPQKGSLRALELKARKLGILGEVSNEVLGDGGQTFEGLLYQQMSQAMGWGLDYAFLSGTGGNGPVGVLEDPALITMTKESGQAANTILYENIVKMYSRLHPACVKRAVWVCNVSTMPQLLMLQMKIKNVAGTENVGGSWVPVLRDDGSGGFTLLGRPVIFTEKTPALSAKGDILLADFSQYIVGLRREMSIEKTQHLGFATDSSHYKSLLRADGMGSWKAAMTPKKGGITLSWAVTLEAR